MLNPPLHTNTGPTLLAAVSRIKNLMVRLLEVTVMLLVAGLVVDVLWQVFTRYVLQRPSSWTDELATLLIVWVALLGSSVAFIRNSHLGVDVLLSSLSPAIRGWIEALVYLLIGCFAVVILIIGGLKLVSLTLLTHQVSPALNVRMGHVYLALPISGFFIAMFALETMMQRLVSSRRHSRCAS